MKKILVTGATGFLGGHLVRYLSKKGYTVTGTGRNLQKGEWLKEEGISFVPGDLQQKDFCQELVRNHHYIIHCAALSEPWGDYQSFYTANVTVTENLLKSAREHGVKRFIHVSTPSIYFRYNDATNVKETAELPKRFANHYAHTKYIAEQKVKQYQEKGLETIIIRPRGLFGPEDSTILPRLLTLNKTKGIPLFNNGKTLIDLTYVENVAHALELSLEKGEVGQTYNISNGEPYSFKSLCDLLFTHLKINVQYKKLPYPVIFRVAYFLEAIYQLPFIKKEPFITRYSVSVLGNSQTLSIEKARKELGYEPLISIEEGIIHYANWYKSIYS
ncbi:NAD(P)-dependent oxidoreductase [Bacillus carboniphilus]|uniref:NAD(P)-dependent oxidoreductase n=1 Tax=Bacillus carboniphilus TaxID=86663 RepID=A0ABP3G1S5_9BACI